MRTIGIAIACILTIGCGSARAETQRFTVSLTVPDAGWSVKITEVYQLSGELAVVAKLSRSSDLAAQMITEVSDSVEIEAPKLPVRYFVIGKTWNWASSEPYTFLPSTAQLPQEVLGGRKLYGAASK